jgi:hypothetical protein
LKTQETVTNVRWTVLSHPPYSPALAASDLNFFGAFKDAIRVKRSRSDDEVIEVAASRKFKLVQEGDRCSCFSLAWGF